MFIFENSKYQTSYIHVLKYLIKVCIRNFKKYA